MATVNTYSNHRDASVKTNGHTGSAVSFNYADRTLSSGHLVLAEDDIISVTEASGHDTAYKVLSVASGEGESSKPFELQITNAILPDNFPRRYQYHFRSLPSYLQPENEIFILISTLSGTNLASAFFDDVLHPLLRSIGLADSKYKVIRTESSETVKRFAEETLLVGAKEGRRQTVVMLSGDGGVVDTLNGLFQEKHSPGSYVKPTLCLLPLGTGNALFHSSHRNSPAIPSIYVQGLRTLLHGKTKALPMFRAKFSPGARILTNEGRTATALKIDTLYGAVVASYGLHSTLVADSDTSEYRKHGDKRFGLVANDLLFPGEGQKPHVYKSEVTLTRGRVKKALPGTEHGYILASLVSNLEKAFTISPKSQPLDGVLRVVYFDALDGNGAMNVMKAAYDSGKHVDLPEVGYEEISGLKIEFKEPGKSWKWRRCCVDGLIVGVEEGGWMEVNSVPAGDEAIDIVADA